MSFLDDIIDVGKGIWDLATGSGVVGGIVKSAGLGFLLNQVTNSINKDNEKPETANNNRPDPGVREQVDPDTNHSVPVVYGQAYLGGIVTDAVLTNDNKTMWYCITICEKTGTKLSDKQPSQISVDAVYWNQNKINFQSDGITAASFTDESGNTSDSVSGLIRVYPFTGGSNSPSKITGQALGNTQPAYNIFPNWTSNHTMNDLVFVLIRVDYSQEKKVTGLGNMEFKIKNTMTQPGDCLHDYMTNERYGAGIKAEEIYGE